MRRLREPPLTSPLRTFFIRLSEFCSVNRFVIVPFMKVVAFPLRAARRMRVPDIDFAEKFPALFMRVPAEIRVTGKVYFFLSSANFGKNSL